MVEYGFATTEERGWVRVAFKLPMPSKPVVLALIEYREGWFSSPSYSAPRKSIDFIGEWMPIGGDIFDLLTPTNTINYLVSKKLEVM
jgi:hypothetical protein